jgi:two-component system sensor histidine kinase RpfC
MTHMFVKLFNHELLSNSEYQQALVRLAIWLFSVVFMWLGSTVGYYSIDYSLFVDLYEWYLIIFLGVLVSIALKQDLPYRRGVTLLIDISATSLAIILTSDAISPFYLIYLWIYISYGTRYGKRLLMAASLLSFFAYNGVLVYLDSWLSHGFDAFFFLLLLLIIPLYQYYLLRQLHFAKEEAESAKQARGDFMTTMTHEMRTPLIGVIGMTRLLQGTPLDKEQKEYLHSIQSSAHLLKSLVNDVFDLSRIDANKLELVSEWVDIRKLVRSVAFSLAEEAHQKQLELLCWIDPKIQFEVFGDKLRISQILFNLLGNAIKFTHSGYVRLELIRIEASRELARPHILIRVEDTGIGIAQDCQESVFDSFWQTDSGKACLSEGIGLGTAVVRDLTRLMGGRVELVSQHGEGSVFSVRLPLQMRGQSVMEEYRLALEGRPLLIYEQDPVAMRLHCTVAREFGMKVISANFPSEFLSSQDNTVELLMVCDTLQDNSITEILYKAHAVAPDLPVIVAGYRGRMHEMGILKDPDNSLIKPFLAEDFAHIAMRALGLEFTRHHTTESEAVLQQRRGIKILLAEDNAIAAKVLSTLLLQRGHKVRITRDGDEALQAVSDDDYEIAFIDLRMPNVDGLEFTRRYRNMEPKHRYMPIYALAETSVERMFEHCIEAGMDGFLIKPVEPETLDAIIEQCRANLDRCYLGDPITLPT